MDARFHGQDKLLDRDVDMHAQPGRGRCLRLGRSRRRSRRGLFQRQGRETSTRTCGLFQRGREIRLWRLRHVQAGARLSGGLLSGNQGGADLHWHRLAKQG